MSRILSLRCLLVVLDVDFYSLGFTFVFCVIAIPFFGLLTILAFEYIYIYSYLAHTSMVDPLQYMQGIHLSCLAESDLTAISRREWLIYHTSLRVTLNLLGFFF